MSQHDLALDVAAVSGPSFRNDVESLAKAILSLSSGTTRPTDIVAGMWFHNTATGVLEMLGEDLVTWTVIIPNLTIVNGGLADTTVTGNLQTEIDEMKTPSQSEVSLTGAQIRSTGWWPLSGMTPLNVSGDWSAGGVWTCPKTGWWYVSYVTRATRNTATSFTHNAFSYNGQAESGERMFEVRPADDIACHMSGTRRVLFTQNDTISPEMFVSGVGGTLTINLLSISMSFDRPL